MPTLRPKMSELAKGLTFATGDRYKIIIPRLTVDVVEMEDIHFHFDSAVVLPWRYGENSQLSSDEQRISGLSVSAAALRYAKANSGRKLLLAGHTDSSGETDYNRKLSKTRAEATQALLKGDKDAWGKACAEHQKVEDLQMVLKWVAEVHGWPYLFLEGIDYQSDFIVPKGIKTGFLGEAGEGGAYDKTDLYLLRHRARFPSGTWEEAACIFPPRSSSRASHPEPSRPRGSARGPTSAAASTSPAGC